MSACGTQEIWQSYRDELYGFLLSRVGRPEDAEDLLQDVMVRTHRRLDSVKDTSRLRSWLFQITRNALVDHYRSSSRDSSLELESRHLGGPNRPEGEDVLEELSRCVRPFLERLPEPYRGTLEAVELRGQSQKELAASLGVSYSTVKSRVQRGRLKLAELFHQCCLYELDSQGNVMSYRARPDRCSC